MDDPRSPTSDSSSSVPAPERPGSSSERYVSWNVPIPDDGRIVNVDTSSGSAVGGLPDGLLDGSEEQAVRERLGAIAEMVNTATVLPPPPPSSAPPSDRGVSTMEAGVEDAERPPAPGPGSLPPGTMLGHFVVTRYIGGGGMGRVYLATDTALDRKVAIKVLPRQRAHDQGVVARFMNEARSAARLNHEHIAQVYFAGEHNGMPFIAFEYVEGTNIRALVEEFGLFPIPQAINFLIQIAHALAHAHLHGVVHRDVKPSNILITKEGRAKLIDMGLARLLNPSESREDLTASGVTLGTFDYISPEQARDPRAADIRSDIYSLGCTLFYMLTGRPPFPEGTVLQKLLQHQGDLPPNVCEFQPGTPVEVAQLVQKMMAKDPRQRFQTPAALIGALVVIAEMLGLKPTGPGRVIWVMRPTSRRSRFLKHLPWLLSVSSLLVIVLGLQLAWRDWGTLPVPDFTPYLQTDDLYPNTVSDEPGNRTGPGGTIVPGTDRHPVHLPASGSEPSPVLAWESDSPEAGWGRFSGYFPGEERARGEAVGQHGVAASPPEGAGGMILGAKPVAFDWGPFHSATGRDEPARWSMATLLLASPDDAVDSETAAQPTAPKTCTVDPLGIVPGSYRSVAAAITATGSTGDAATPLRIELRSNQTIPTPPLTVTGRRIHITAANGFTPTLLFSAGEGGGTLAERSMCTLGAGALSAGELAFSDITLDFAVPQEISASRWTFFEILDAATLSLEHCVVTIRNSAIDSTGNPATYHQEVAFFRCVAPPLGLNPANTGTTATVPPVEIRLRDVVVRGEASILYTEVERNIGFSVKNAFIASNKPLIAIDSPKKLGDGRFRLRLDLDQTTVFLHAPLIRQTRTSAADTPLPIQAGIRDSILALRQNPLVDFRGIGTLDANASTLRWSENGAVFYEEVPFAWNLKPLTGAEMFREMGWEEWDEIMNTTAKRDIGVFERSSRLPTKPVSRMVPSEWMVRQDTSNPAYRVVPGPPETPLLLFDAGMNIAPLPKVADEN